jgi:hypothetical protein
MNEQNADYVRVGEHGRAYPMRCQHGHVTQWDVRDVLPTDPVPEIEPCDECAHLERALRVFLDATDDLPDDAEQGIRAVLAMRTPNADAGAAFQIAQLREWLIETEQIANEAMHLLDEWDKRETALAIAMCGSEPVVQPGSFVDRVRRLLTRQIGGRFAYKVAE